jgi:hypothetical protein
MALFQRVEALEAEIAALKAVPPAGVTADQLAAVEAQVVALRADVGVPTPPAP